MGKRQFARKQRGEARPDLRLVPAPKPKRRTRRWPRPFRWSYKRAVQLHAYEDRFVVGVMIERGGIGCALDWCEREPGRWDKTYLDKTFKRLSARGYVKAIGVRKVHFTTGWRRRLAMQYELMPLGRDAYEKGRL